MADWDADTAALHANLRKLADKVRRQAAARLSPSLDLARRWHRDMMAGLSVPDQRWVGAFRGETGLKTVNIRIGPHFGAPAQSVAGELEAFEGKLYGVITILDAQIAPGNLPDTDSFNAVVDVCAWVHSEWVRIHPFVNGNGRIARIWVNFIAARYGLPAFLRLRPRPDQPYGAAGADAMTGDWRPTARLFHGILADYPD